MKDNNQNEPSLFLFAVIVIIVLIIIVYIIVQLATGVFLFLQSGGWRWVLIICGVLLAAFLIGHAKGDW